MPTIHVNRAQLFHELKKEFTNDQFDELCFEFGIELDEVTSERQLVAKEQGEDKAANLSDEAIYRIEVPANRYDLLTTEGLTRALKCYLASTLPPEINTVGGPISLTVTSCAASSIRPFMAMAVLRNITMTPAIYESLIDLQEKLSGGIGRKRTIFSVGTHDLDAVHPDFVYDASPPETIQFTPLNRQQQVNGREMIKLLESDLKIRKYLPYLQDATKYPHLKDSQGLILGVIPIINSNQPRLHMGTKNILIDVTGTDWCKVNICLNILTTTFARYCNPPNVIERVTIKRPDGSSFETPDLSSRKEAISLEYINRTLGLNLTTSDACALLARMMLDAKPASDNYLTVTVPPHRPDVIHACDIMEDVGIAYGFNRIPSRIPPTSCTGATEPLNKLTDLLRREVALTGFTEVLTFSLCSHDENYAWLKKVDPGQEAIVLANPKTIEFEVVHTSLIPAMLKTIASNKKMALPLRIFQIADVAFQDSSTDTGARNERRLCAVYCGMSSGFEIIHGLLDRVMLMLNVSSQDYVIKPSELPTFFPGRQAQVFYKGKIIGAFGIVHPEVTTNFDAPYVSSLLEITIEPFL